MSTPLANDVNGEKATVPAPAPQRRNAAASPLHAAFQLFLCVVLYGMLNGLSCQRHYQYDATRKHISTLSETTRNVLRLMDNKTRITVAFVNESALKEKTWRLAKAYADAQPKFIRATLLDPVRDPDNARDMAKRFKHEFKDNTVLVTREKRIEVIPESALELQRRGQDGKTKSVGFIAEDAITAAILRVQSPIVPVVYLIAGKGPWPATPNGNGSDTLRTLLPRYNATLRELSLEGIEAIPEDAAAVILANPRYDLSGKEVRILRDFWEQRKGGLLFLLNPSAATPNLEAFLKYHGVQPDRRTVLKSKENSTSSGKELSVAIRFAPGAALTDPFVNADARLPGSSGFLKVDTSRDDLRLRRIKPFVLAESTTGYWAESDAEESVASFDPAYDVKGPLCMVAAVERSAVEDDKVRVPAARMVIFANPHLLDPDALQQVNVDFFFSALNWLMDRDMLIGIGPRQPVLYQAAISDRESRTLHAIVLAGLPAIALSLAWIVHQRRRS